MNYLNRPMALTQAQAAMANTGQNPNIFDVYRPYRTPSAIIPGVKSVITQDRGKNVIISLDGQDVRRKINIVWISIGLFFSAVMFYLAYAALADLPPFSTRGPAGGTVIPKPIEILPPKSLGMTTLETMEAMVEPTTFGIMQEPIVLDLPAPKVSIIKTDETVESSVSYSYGVTRVTEDSLEPTGETSWSEDKDLKEGDKVKLTLYPNKETSMIAVLKKNTTTDSIVVLASLTLSPHIPRIIFDDI